MVAAVFVVERGTNVITKVISFWGKASTHTYLRSYVRGRLAYANLIGENAIRSVFENREYQIERVNRRNSSQVVGHANFRKFDLTFEKLGQINREIRFPTFKSTEEEEQDVWRWWRRQWRVKVGGQFAWTLIANATLFCLPIEKRAKVFHVRQTHTHTDLSLIGKVFMAMVGMLLERTFEGESRSWWWR